MHRVDCLAAFDQRRLQVGAADVPPDDALRDAHDDQSEAWLPVCATATWNLANPSRARLRPRGCDSPTYALVRRGFTSMTTGPCGDATRSNPTYPRNPVNARATCNAIRSTSRPSGFTRSTTSMLT